MSGELRPGVLFDVDGTLVDTNYLHALAWSRAFRDAGEWVPMNAIHRLVGMGGDQLVPELLGHENPDAIAARPHRYQQLVDDIRPFPRAGELLREVHDTGLAVVLATSASHDELQTLRQALDADDAIDGQTTADDITQTKPAPEVFAAAMTRFGIDPRRALAVGDSIWDVRAARAAGIACVTVETGGFSQHELSEAGALHVYRDVAELLDQLHTSPLAQLVPTKNTGLSERSGADPGPNIPPDPAPGMAVPTGHTPDGGVLVGINHSRRHLIIFEDPQCPSCRRFEEHCGDLLRREIAAGNINIEYRIRCCLGPASIRAANALALAAEAGRFHQLHAELLGAQPAEGDAYSADDLIEFGRRAGLIGPDYVRGVRSGRYHEWAEHTDHAFAADDPDGTPAALLDGQAVEQDKLYDPEALGHLFRH